MKFIKAIIFAAIPWYPIGWKIFEMTQEMGLALICTSIISIIVFLFFFNRPENESSAIKDLKDGSEFYFVQKIAVAIIRAIGVIIAVGIIVSWFGKWKT